MRYEIVNWGGETLYETNDLARAVSWCVRNGRSGDALWDTESDEDKPVLEVG